MKRKRHLIIASILAVFTLTGCVYIPPDTPTDKPQNNIKTVEKKPTAVDRIEPRPINLILGNGHLWEHAEDSYEAIAQAEYPVVQLYYGDEDNYPELNKAINQMNDDTRNNTTDEFRELCSMAYEMKKELPDMFHKFEDINNSYVRRADSTTVSILEDRYIYSGGVHGNTYMHGTTYDSKTGALLSFSDVVNDISAIPSMVDEQLKKFYGEDVFFDSVDMTEIMSDESNFAWTLDPHGLSIYFSPYVIAPYAAGVQHVTLTNAEYPGLVKEKYKEVPSAYAIQLETYMPFYADVTGDGMIDEIFLSHSYDYDTDSMSTVQISINDMKFEDEIYAYDSSATFIHTKNGKNLLYIELSMANDYKESGKYHIELLQRGGNNTFTNKASEYIRTQLERADLFRAGDVFDAAQYTAFLTDGRMDDGSEFGYTIQILSIEENGADSTATIRITRK